MEEDYVQTVPCVHVGEGEWIATDKVEFVDISEDIQGYDIMTFIYEGKEMQSRIRSYPC
jgi:predicted thioredoxin/glutaredoxin